IKYYINDSLIVQWQDPEPLQSGNSISLRTAGCSAEYDNVSVYKSRSETVSVEVSLSGHMRYESLNALPTGKVKSLALDLYDNWSLQESEEYLIDWSIPELTFLNDGSFSNDIDTITTALIEGNWLAVDIHSSIGTYEIAIGTLPSLNDIMDWTDLGTANLFSQVLSTTEFGTTYHIALRATNGAGLTDLFVSDGQTLIDPNLGVGIEENTLAEIGIFPNPASDHLYFSGFAPGISYTIVDSFGKKIFFGDSPSIDISNWAAGMYTVLLQYGSDIRKEKVILR
ncbi:MAG: hypothetical protein RIT43_1603, partial [Bacteroidota bacterium]